MRAHTYWYDAEHVLFVADLYIYILKAHSTHVHMLISAKSICVCVCVCVRARVCVCICMHVWYMDLALYSASPYTYIPLQGT